MFFHALTFAGSCGSCSKMRPQGTGTNMGDHYSCILYDSMKTPAEDALKNEEIVALSALKTAVDTILFFIFLDAIPQGM